MNQKNEVKVMKKHGREIGGSAFLLNNSGCCFHNIPDNRKRKWKTCAEAAQPATFKDQRQKIRFNFVKSESSKKPVESCKKSVGLEAIINNLLNAEFLNSFKASNTLLDICVGTSVFHNSFDFVSETTKTEPVMLFAQDKETLEIANFTGCQNNCNTEGFRMKEYFCSDTVFLSQVEKELFEITSEPTSYSNLS